MELCMNLNDAMEEYYERGLATMGRISVHCDPDEREEIGNFLQSKFDEKWVDVVKSFADTFKDPELWLEEGVEENSPPPVSVRVVSDGLNVSVGSLAVCYDCGEYYCGTGDDALEEALHAMVKAYPGVTYEGYVSYCLQDTRSGEWVWYSVRSPGNDYPAGKVHTGEFLAAAMGDDYFWDSLEERMDNLNDFEEVMGDFVNYKEWLPDEAFDKLLKLADQVDKDFRPVLEKKMSEPSLPDNAAGKILIDLGEQSAWRDDLLDGVGPMDVTEIMRKNLETAGKDSSDEALENMSVEDAYEALLGIFYERDE